MEMSFGQITTPFIYCLAITDTEALVSTMKFKSVAPNRAATSTSVEMKAITTRRVSFPGFYQVQEN